jgi:hypothetical protein
MFDVLLLEVFPAYLALFVLGSAKIKNFAADKEVGVFTHQNHHHYRKLF